MKPSQRPVAQTLPTAIDSDRRALLAQASQAGLSAGLAGLVLTGLPVTVLAQASAQASAQGSSSGSGEQGRVVKRFVGKAYEASSQALLYTEQHVQTYLDNRWLNGTVRYLDAQGGLWAEKTLDFSKDPFIPVARLVIPGLSYEEKISEVTANHVLMETRLGEVFKTEKVARSNPMAADSGFHSLIVSRLSEIAQGNPVSVRFGVAGKRTAYDFRLRRAAPSRDGRQLEIIGEPDNLLRFVVPPLKLTYDLQNGNLLEYRGLSNLRDLKTGETPSVRIVYSYS